MESQKHEIVKLEPSDRSSVIARLPNSRSHF